MQKNENKPATGSLRISQDVIATIASYAVTEIDGVASLAVFSGNMTGWLLKKQTSKPVVVDLNDDVATIDINVVLKYGAKIPEVSQAIQRSVKESVQNMTGITVTKVNINISGIHFGSDNTAI